MDGNKDEIRMIGSTIFKNFVVSTTNVSDPKIKITKNWHGIL